MFKRFFYWSSHTKKSQLWYSKFLLHVSYEVHLLQYPVNYDNPTEPVIFSIVKCCNLLCYMLYIIIDNLFFLHEQNCLLFINLSWRTMLWMLYIMFSKSVGIAFSCYMKLSWERDDNIMCWLPCLERWSCSHKL